MWYVKSLRFMKKIYPRHLPTPTTHTHDPRPLPTIHATRHLATLLLHRYTVAYAYWTPS